MVANGYTINKHGGAFSWGVARSLEDKARVALVYLCLKEVNPDSEVLIREVERLGECSWGFAKKLANEIENDGHLILWERGLYRFGGGWLASFGTPEGE